MGNYSGQGYITLADLESLETRINTLESHLGITASDLTSGNFIMFRDNSAKASGSTALSIDNAGIEVIRHNINVKASVIKGIKFSQTFVSPPIVVAGADASKADFAVFVDNVTKTGCDLRIVKVGTSTAASSSGGEHINIIAIGKTA